MKECKKCYAKFSGRQCNVCRKNERYGANGQRVDIPCVSCGVKTRLSSNGECKPCLDSKGMKECRACRVPQLRDLNFGRNKSNCYACSRSASALSSLYFQVLETQEGLCAICSQESSSPFLQLGEALVCSGCAQGIRMLNCDPTLLRAAAELLES